MRRVVIVCAASIIAAGVGIGARNLYGWIFTENHTDSLPRGIYVRTFSMPRVGSILWFRMQPSMREYLRNYPSELAWLGNPRNGFLKPIVAVAGDAICRSTDGIFSVNGTPLGIALKSDHRGYPLPFWSGCEVLSYGRVAVFSDYAAGSLDSRYFGSIEIDGSAKTYRPFITWGNKR